MCAAPHPKKPDHNGSHAYTVDNRVCTQIKGCYITARFLTHSATGYTPCTQHRSSYHFLRTKPFKKRDPATIKWRRANHDFGENALQPDGSVDEAAAPACESFRRIWKPVKHRDFASCRDPRRQRPSRCCRDYATACCHHWQRLRTDASRLPTASV